MPHFGAFVSFFGIVSKPELNASNGKVIAFNSKSSRFTVQSEFGELNIRCENIRPGSDIAGGCATEMHTHKSFGHGRNSALEEDGSVIRARLVAWLCLRPNLTSLNLSGLGPLISDSIILELLKDGAVAGSNSGAFTSTPREIEVNQGGAARCLMPKLKRLNLTGCIEITAPAVEAVISKHLANTEICLEVQLRFCWRVASPGIQWTARDVVELQLKALQEGGRIDARALPDFLRRQPASCPTEGTSKAFEFASPENQRATGPAEQ